MPVPWRSSMGAIEERLKRLTAMAAKVPAANRASAGAAG